MENPTQQQQRFNNLQHLQQFHSNNSNNNSNSRQRLQSADYIYGPSGRPSSKNHHPIMTPSPHSRSVSTSDFYELNHHNSNTEEDPTEKHINKNILIEPMVSTTTNPTSSTANNNSAPSNTFLHPTPPRSRSPSPSVSDGDSGYSSKQMSPVSLVSLTRNNSRFLFNLAFNPIF